MDVCICVDIASVKN